MADVAIRKGDRLPQLERQFTLNGTGVDLSGSTVVFNMWNAATGTQVITNGSCTIVTAASGTVKYLWTATDATLDAGNYLASFTATYSDGRKLTAPNDSMLSVEIYAEVASTWSYTGNPSARAIDAIRFLIGDTDVNDQLLTDDEIEWVNIQASGTATSTTDLYDAAYRCCLNIAAKLSRQADKQIGDLSVKLSQKAQAYRTQADSLRQLSMRSSGVPVPYAGGITISDKDIDRQNSDINSQWFQSGQFLNVRDGGAKIETGVNSSGDWL